MCDGVCHCIFMDIVIIILTRLNFHRGHKITSKALNTPELVQLVIIDRGQLGMGNVETGKLMW